MNHVKKLTILESAELKILEEIAKTSQAPVLLKGVISEWPAVKAGKKSALSLQTYLLGFDTQKEMLAFEADESAAGRVFYNKSLDGWNFTRPMYLLTDFFDKLNQLSGQGEKPALYMGSTNADKWLPGFTSANSLEFGVDDKIVNVWMGNQSDVAAHMDFPDNLACCVAGKRTFTLFPPEQLENLYIGPLDNTPAGPAISLVDHQQPDFKKYPNYQKALDSSIVVELEPGDVLFIPSMWWHQVSAAEDFNMLVNYWWKKLPRYIPSAMDALTYSILTIKDLPKEQKVALRTWFDYYIFDDNELSHIPNHAKGNLGKIDEKQARKMRANLLNVLNR